MSETSLLDLRLNSLQKAQERSRTAFFLSIIASAVVGITIFNRTLSWEAPKPLYPTPNTAENIAVYGEKLKARMGRDSYTLPLLGVSVSAWDLGFIGPASLLVFAFYFFAASRSVSSLIADFSNQLPEGRVDLERAYLGLKSQMVLNSPDENESQGWLMRALSPRLVYTALICVPFAISLSSIVSALYLFTLNDAFRDVPLWKTMSRTQWIQTIACDCAGFLQTLLIFFFTKSILADNQAVRTFATRLKELRDGRQTT
jgi:hypothetical protein